MRYLLIVSFFVITGCATSPYGNFTNQKTTHHEISSQDTHDVIAKDALSQLSSHYPPAKTKLSFIHEIDKNDTFGLLLVNKMRISGYAIQEYRKDTDPTGLTFAYTLDQIEDIYRLTIYIAGQRLSRPYLFESGVVTPSGPWSRKE